MIQTINVCIVYNSKKKIYFLHKLININIVALIYNAKMIFKNI